MLIIYNRIYLKIIIPSNTYKDWFERFCLKNVGGFNSVCFIGRTTREGYREIMIYGANREKLSEIMNRFVRENTFSRSITFQIENDDN
jgi:hypothetical protein